jgi:hypothetical protein
MRPIAGSVSKNAGSGGKIRSIYFGEANRPSQPPDSSQGQTRTLPNAIILRRAGGLAARDSDRLVSAVRSILP